ncbi:MAG TPA: MarR family transcriptional regulator [Acidimicrobiales bacterium]|nr:MarR family transcriptional regulator [Acidimicrobiales bacterium]
MAQGRTLAVDPVAEARRQWSARGWDEAAAGMAVVTSVMRVQQLFMARADAVLRPFGLSFARYEVLMLLFFSRRGELPLHKVGERLQVGAASVTHAVDRLQADGLVARRSNPADGRGVLASLTPSGRRIAPRASAALNAQVFARLDLAPGQLESLFTLLAQVRRGAGDFA